MSRSNALPLSLTHAVALAHIADLRAEAERHQLARAVRTRRRVPAWPATVVAALRDSLAGADRRPSQRRGTERHACVTC
jgi:ribosomal protein L39E